MDDIIVIWPPGTYYFDCYGMSGGTYWDCTGSYPELMNAGAMVCCPAF
jgi:hypothetical protein